jgi:hypothetical protein
MKYLIGVGVRTCSGIFMHKFCSGLAAILLGLAAVPLVGTALAQDRSTSDRLDRLERDLNQVQRQLYRNEVPVSGPPGVAPSGDGSQALNTENRLDQLEQQMRTLTGQIEELQNGISSKSPARQDAAGQRAALPGAGIGWRRQRPAAPRRRYGIGGTRGQACLARRCRQHGSAAQHRRLSERAGSACR